MPYLPGRQPAQPGPLARYLPLLPAGAGAAWLEARLPTAEGPWVLDPFGASPGLAIEAAQAGYRVLAAVNNPVMRFLYETLAAPPAREELQGAIANLAAARRGDERLEPHIRALYRTECAGCRREIEAEAYIWEREAETPAARIYHCPFCGDAGERPVTEGDAARASQFGTAGLHRARALERVAPKDDPDRHHVEEALEFYPARAVYVLFTLINKLEGMEAPGGHPLRRRWLEALLISTLDAANTLWPHPIGRARPRQLTVPPRYREHNPWLALEAAVQEWAAGANTSPIPIVPWPHPLPPGGGICLYEGRLKDLADECRSGCGPVERFAAVLSALPRPNQAFWTLSALWSGWLWGRAAVEPFKVALRRRRYDWGWHATAMSAAFGHLAGLLEEGAPILGLMSEPEPGFLSAVLLAASRSGLLRSGLALRAVQRAESGGAQIAWLRSGSATTHNTTRKEAGGGAPGDGAAPGDSVTALETASQPPPSASALRNLIQASGLEVLRQRGEPSPYLVLHAAALQALVDDPSALQALPPEADEALEKLQDLLQNAFTYQEQFRRYSGSRNSLDVGLWWLPEGPAIRRRTSSSGARSEKAVGVEQYTLPLADRVEMAVVRALQKDEDDLRRNHKHGGGSEDVRDPLPAGGITFEALETVLCAAFPGLLTPGENLIRACLESYAELVQSDPQRWRLRSSDTARARRADLAEMQHLLERTGRRLGYEVLTAQGAVAEILRLSRQTQAEALRYENAPRREPVLWCEVGGQVRNAFYPIASAVVGDLLPHPPFPPERCILLYPGGRAGLLHTKLERDPRLHAALEVGWRTVKFRHLRRLSENEGLNRAVFETQLHLDPLENEGTQLPLL